MSDELPPEVAERARHLGPAIDSFPSGVGAWRFVGVLGFAALGGLFAAPAADALGKGDLALAAWFVILSSFFLIPAVGLFAYLRRLRSMRACLFAGGVVGVVGSRSVVWGWDQVAEVRQKVTTPGGGGGGSVGGGCWGPWSRGPRWAPWRRRRRRGAGSC